MGGSQSEAVVHPGGEGVAAGARGSWARLTHRQETERDELWCSAHSLFIIQSRTQLMGCRCPRLCRLSLPQLSLFGNTLTVSPRGALSSPSKTHQADSEDPHSQAYRSPASTFLLTPTKSLFSNSPCIV